jgi:hypothetical protein
MVDQAVEDLAPLIGTRVACSAIGQPRATYYRRHRRRPTPPPSRPTRGQAPQPRALSSGERAAVLGLLHHARFVDH